jgi:hypothetical protein
MAEMRESDLPRASKGAAEAPVTPVKPAPPRGARDAPRRAEPLRRMFARGGSDGSARLAGIGLYLLVLGSPLMFALLYHAATSLAPKPGVRNLLRENWEHIVNVSRGHPSPWSQVATVDALLGIMFFNVWITYRHKSVLTAAAWCLSNWALGMASGCAYICFALVGCRGEWAQFWLGDRAGDGDESKKA